MRGKRVAMNNEMKTTGRTNYSLLHCAILKELQCETTTNSTSCLQTSLQTLFYICGVKQMKIKSKQKPVNLNLDKWQYLPLSLLPGLVLLLTPTLFLF
jgi:hypothetical protein